MASPTRTAPESDFEKLRQQHLKNKQLFEDPDFPAEDSSVFFSRNPPYRLQWMRPSEIARLGSGLPPKFFVDGTSRFDLKQGELGDCWVLAAAASVCNNKKIIDWLVPPLQSFDSGWYAGIFKFRFWRYGRWVDVLVDDRLPTYKGQLVFVHSNQPNEFWGSLLEKAYAKLHGTYEAIKGGSNADSLTDFTGGLVESYSMKEVPRNFPKLLSKAFQRKSVIAASIYGDSVNNPVRRNGLVAGHAYSVTAYTEVTDNNGKQRQLIRIRNPWGSNAEWNGPWSDSSTEWNNLTAEEKTAMGLVKKDDGEFWMSLFDFVANYDSIEICNLTADSLLDAPKSWTVSTQNGSWKTGANAGGRPSNTGYFYTNTQYHLKLQDHEDDTDKLASLVVELMQKDRRANSQTGYNNLAIGFIIYRVPAGIQLPLTKSNLYDEKLMAGTSDEYINSRSVTKRFELTPGDYVIIPTTWDPNEEADYMLRVFSEAAHDTRGL